MFGSRQVVSQRIAAAAFVGVALSALSGCGGNVAAGPVASTGAATPAGPVIKLSLLMFGPDHLTVPVGTRLTWQNDEDITHTVTSGTFLGVDKSTGLRSSQKPDGLFDAKLPGKGDTFTFTFTHAGTYDYYCDIHEGMNAEVVVTG